MVLDQNVSVTHEVPQYLAPFLGFQVEDNGTFVGVISNKGEASLRMGHVVFEGPLASHRVASRRVGEKNVCANIGEKHAAVTSHATGQVQDPQTGQRAG